MPTQRQKFLRDQRNRRSMNIPTNAIRSFPSNPQLSNCRKSPIRTDDNEQIFCDDSVTIDSSSNYNHRTLRNGKSIDPDHVPVSTMRNNVVLTETAKVADRRNISNRDVAAITTAVLNDFGIVGKEKTQFVIDSNKVWRNRNKARNLSKKEHEENLEPIQALYFDGRIDDTKEKVGFKIKTIKCDHIALVQEPGSKYINHISPELSTGAGISEGIVSYFKSNDIDLSALVAVGCDGCNTNTGWENGALPNLERTKGHSVQWIVCLLHFDELPFKALITKYDGATTGPRSYSGPIGRKLLKCEELPIAHFEPIEFRCDVPNLDDISLSADQRYLFDICTSISNGSFELKALPGKMGHSRWITTASRVCRLYVSTERPSDLLVVLVKYILWVYAPAHFEIKYRSSIVFGPIHLFNVIERIQFLNREAKQKKYYTTLVEAIQRNGFFAHPENLLLAMLNDDNQQIRQQAWQKI